MKLCRFRVMKSWPIDLHQCKWKVIEWIWDQYQDQGFSPQVVFLFSLDSYWFRKSSESFPLCARTSSNSEINKLTFEDMHSKGHSWACWSSFALFFSSGLWTHSLLLQFTMKGRIRMTYQIMTDQYVQQLAFLFHSWYWRLCIGDWHPGQIKRVATVGSLYAFKC